MKNIKVFYNRIIEFLRNNFVIEKASSETREKSSILTESSKTRSMQNKIQSSILIESSRRRSMPNETLEKPNLLLESSRKKYEDQKPKCMVKKLNSNK